MATSTKATLGILAIIITVGAVIVGWGKTWGTQETKLCNLESVVNQHSVSLQHGETERTSIRINMASMKSDVARLPSIEAKLDRLIENQK